MLWTVIGFSRKHIYLFGRDGQTYLTGKIGKNVYIDSVNSSSEIAKYMQTNMYTSGSIHSQYKSIMNRVSNLPLIRTTNTFKCISCRLLKTIYTAIPCLHTMCSECVSEYQYNSMSCPKCSESIGTCEGVFHDIPVNHLTRMIKETGDNMEIVVGGFDITI